ncbi:MAG: RagB/SusD family nutrient uptake outer membrane protein [Candidatus Symbiothrix sp.]|jgi:hypothetical protein|nr:RagB/SusD family nutrient uptake outer membrane protein [Candidatus Symbiothrix sp.]
MKIIIKKLKNSLIGLIALMVVLFALNACTDYLNVEHLLNDQLDEEEVFENMDYSKLWLANIYSHLRHDDNWDVSTKEQNRNQFNFISDDMYYTDREKAGDYFVDPDDGKRYMASYRVYRGGQYSEAFLQDQWLICYKGIRDASTYIKNIDRLLNGDNIREGMDADQLAKHIRETKAEARFLRAYYYWQLLRKYGPLPLLPDEGIDFTADYEELAIPRSPYHVCAEYIASELAKAALDLPSHSERGSSEIFKPSRGAALAARAKVYLFAASPQYNGNSSEWAQQLRNNDGTPLITPKEQYNEELWAKAAAAAREVMDLGDGYRLYTVPKADAGAFNMKKGDNGAAGSALEFDFDRYPKTIEPGRKIVQSGATWKIEEQFIDGYSDKSFPEGWANIDPVESYRQLFDGSLIANSNPELIFSRGYGNQMDKLSEHQIPVSLSGWNCHGLTMKMYDAYYMADGSDFYRYKSTVDDQGRKYFYSDPKAVVPDYAKEFTEEMNVRRWQEYPKWTPLPPGVSLQNANREPRFYASVAYNGSIWENEESDIVNNNRYVQVFTYRNHKDGKNAEGWYYWTGIGIRKYYNPKDRALNSYVRKAEPAIRYAEVLLTYAEALNELTQAYDIPSYHPDKPAVHVERTPEEISRGLRPVRVRAGLTDFTTHGGPANTGFYNDREEMRMRIKREWQIEFMGEAHRYYDLRRWGDAEREESMPVYGFSMDMTGPEKWNSTTYGQRDLWVIPREVSIIPAIFAPKMYLWPIAKIELQRNRNMVQNPGWQTFSE